jgi:hypothetical protein
MSAREPIEDVGQGVNTAVIASAGVWTVFVDGASQRAEMDAGAVLTFSQVEQSIRPPFGLEDGKPLWRFLFRVNVDAGVVATFPASVAWHSGVDGARTFVNHALTLGAHEFVKLPGISGMADHHRLAGISVAVF